MPELGLAERLPATRNIANGTVKRAYEHPYEPDKKLILKSEFGKWSRELGIPLELLSNEQQRSYRYCHYYARRLANCLLPQFFPAVHGIGRDTLVVELIKGNSMWTGELEDDFAGHEDDLEQFTAAIASIGLSAETLDLDSFNFIANDDGFYYIDDIYSPIFGYFQAWHMNETEDKLKNVETYYALTRRQAMLADPQLIGISPEGEWQIFDPVKVSTYIDTLSESRQQRARQMFGRLRHHQRKFPVLPLAELRARIQRELDEHQGR